MRTYQAYLTRKPRKKTYTPADLEPETQPMEMTITREAENIIEARETFERQFGANYNVVNVHNYLCVPAAEDIPGELVPIPKPAEGESFEYTWDEVW